MLSRSLGVLNGVWNGVLDIVYPPCCLICRRLDTPVICDACRADFGTIQGCVCSLCGRPGEAMSCPDCAHAQERGGWQFDAARAAAHYDGTLALAIQRLKYNRVELLGEPLGKYLAERLLSGQLYAPDILAEIESVIPVPLHQSRLRQRGFNQAEKIARPVAEALGRPLLTRVLRRRKKTKQQVGLSAPERRDNMAQEVFAIGNMSQLPKRGILLIDDVFTTGATLDACAAVLRAGNMEGIYALTLAVGI